MLPNSLISDARQTAPAPTAETDTSCRDEGRHMNTVSARKNWLPSLLFNTWTTLQVPLWNIQIFLLEVDSNFHSLNPTSTTASMTYSLQENQANIKWGSKMLWSAVHNQLGYHLPEEETGQGYGVQQLQGAECLEAAGLWDSWQFWPC